MDRLKFLLVIVILTFTKNALLANKKNDISPISNLAIKENILLNVNSNVVLAGERLYFSAVCINNSNSSLSQLSKIAHIELINRDKKVVLKQKIVLTNGKGQGFFFVPSDFKSDKYILLGYTNWMLNSNSVQLNSTEITVINTYQSLDKKEEKIVSSNQDNSNIVFKNLNEFYALNKKEYKKREQIKINLNNIDLFQNHINTSIKILKKDSLSIYFEKQKKISNQPVTLVKKTTEIVLPEFRGEIISGKIKSNDEKISVKNIDLSISITGKNPFFKIIKTDNLGNFNFSIENQTENKKLLIQVLNDDYEKYNIEINQFDHLDYSNLTFGNFSLNESINKSLENRSVANQIENVYSNTKKDRIINKETKQDFLKLETVYNLDNYNRFNSLKETLTEIISNAYFKKIGKKNTIQIMDNIREYDINSPALVLVDGIQIQDVDELFNYNIDNVKSIGVNRDGYFLGTKIFNGLFSIETINKDYESRSNYIVSKEITRVSQELIYFNPDYSKTDSSRIPDYRHQLLWIPSLNKETSEIEFYTSDNEGTYEIILETINTKGETVFYKDSFEVK